MVSGFALALFVLAQTNAVAPSAPASVTTDSSPASATSSDTNVPPRVYKVGGLISGPRIVNRAEPSYTPLARKRKISGITVVTLVVDAEGHPQNVHVLHSMAEKIKPKQRDAALSLDQAAVDAVSKYRFAPAMMGDKPVPV